MNTQALPWYTYKIVWLVIAIPAASVFAGMFMIYLAVNTDDGLVVDDYYKEGMAINQSLLRDKSATELGLSAQLRVEEAGDMVRLSFNKGALANYPDRMTLHFQHATHAGHDQILALVRAPEDQYIGYLKQTIKEGVWHIMLSTEQWRLVERVHWQNGLNINLRSQ
ncbi:MAG: FixH family protein [Gammaproteobacteria bacterium]|jgi:hypothetical protein